MKYFFNVQKRANYDIDDLKNNREVLFYNNFIKFFEYGSIVLCKLRPNEIIMDYFVVNLDDFMLLNLANVNDDFVRVFKNLITDRKDKIKVVRNEAITQFFDKEKNTLILEVNNGKIVKFDAMDTKEIKDNFLFYDNSLESFKGDNIYQIGERFLFENNMIRQLNLPNVRFIDKLFLYFNQSLEKLNLPNLKKVGKNVLMYNKVFNHLNIEQGGIMEGAIHNNNLNIK